MCANIFVPAQADAFRRRNAQVSASRFFLWVCLADLVAVLWHAGQLVLSGEQPGGLRGCRWLCGPAGLGTRNCTGECADGPAGGCLCGCIWLCCLGMPCHQELDQGMRRWASWWLALQQPAGGRSQMADGEGREGRWWPVGGLARTKPAALRATRLHPCVVTLGLASNTPPPRHPRARATEPGAKKSGSRCCCSNSNQKCRAHAPGFGLVLYLLSPHASFLVVSRHCSCFQQQV